MSRPSPPLIAVNGLLCEDETPRLELALRYGEAVVAAGGLPVAIGPVGGAAQLAALLERLDGVLLTGGDDFATERLGLGPTHPCATPTPARKQDWDFQLARAAVARKVPLLGICYGMQVLGLAEGGRMHQHLPEDRPGSLEHTGGVVHPVTAEPGSKLRRLLGVEALDVISRHHQALSAVCAPWRVSARDEEGLIEAIEREGHPFAVGVQWHPELSSPDGPHGGLFRGLVAAAAERAEQGPPPRDDRSPHDMDAVTWKDPAGNPSDPLTPQPPTP
ncbi:MAG: gamma-glutamyl-gamma-aminobutyrate hydrolase family protein [Planctomycetota bacterium]|jgi:putative glutamine amidotransferase|nr:gamma-glutamyl-gamma-aminobutyrate hydrolase family protein [Planctomycetota bacterium]